MAERCLCESGNVAVFACSGGSNVGQLANLAAVDLARSSNECRFYCLAGIGGHVSGITESARAADRVVAIDGCKVSCGRRALEHAGIEVDLHLVLTEMGMEKNHELDVEQEVREAAARWIREAMGS
ncbi:MAG: zinc-binding protein [Methanosarcinales archaeon]|nr:zinc-binding protein [Methanosarcinales archaeon]